MLTVSNLKRVRYFPELIPDGTFYQEIQAGQTGSPPPLDLRRLTDRATEIDGLRVTPHPNLELEFRVDNFVKETVRTELLTSNDFYPFRFAGEDTLALDVRNVGASALQNVRVEYGLWVWEATTADRILRGWQLEDLDKNLNNEHGVQATVEKGLLPLPREYALQREYQLLRRMVHPVAHVNIEANAEKQLILNVAPMQHPGFEEYLVLERFTCSNNQAGLVIIIERDEDPQYVIYNTKGMLGPVRVWIPALHELRVYVESPVQVSDVSFTFQIGRYRLNNILRARWNLAREADLPGDVWQKVAAGIL